MLTLANLSKDARAGALTLESFKSALQRLVFANTDFGHFISLLSAERAGIPRQFPPIEDAHAIA